jgi:Mitochondrial distribution and morphology protein 10
MINHFLRAASKLLIPSWRCDLLMLEEYGSHVFLNMLEFMDYVQYAFYNVSHWNYENSYSHLTATARGEHIPFKFLDSY